MLVSFRPLSSRPDQRRLECTRRVQRLPQQRNLSFAPFFTRASSTPSHEPIVIFCPVVINLTQKNSQTIVFTKKHPTPKNIHFSITSVILFAKFVSADFLWFPQRAAAGVAAHSFALRLFTWVPPPAFNAPRPSPTASVTMKLFQANCGYCGAAAAAPSLCGVGQGVHVCVCGWGVRLCVRVCVQRRPSLGCAWRGVRGWCVGMGEWGVCVRTRVCTLVT